MQEKVVEYVQDAHAMEQSGLQMLDSLIASTKDAQMKADLELHRQQTERQVERLRQRLEELGASRSEEHTSELQSLAYLVCRLLLEKKKRDKQLTNTPMDNH